MNQQWIGVLALIAVTACARDTTAPGTGNTPPSTTAVRSTAAAVAVTEIVDLDVGAALGILAGGTGRVLFNADATAVNDSGWVFIADPLRKRGLVWLDDETGAYPPDARHLKPLPTDLRWLGDNTNTDPYNGRGDYLPYLGYPRTTTDKVVMADGTGGWVAGPPLEPPAGFVAGEAYAWGINDSRLVVGHGRNPLRKWKWGGGTNGFESPVAWTVNELGQATTTTTLPIPAASAGCLVGSVRALAVNDNGVIIGYAQEWDAKSGNNCGQKAVLWRTATSTPILLPPATAIPGFPARLKSNELHWSAMHVNNAGVVAGRVNYRGDTRVVRWRKVAGTESYGPPEFNGFWSFPAALDECGRVVVNRFGPDSYTGVWGAGATDVPVRLPVPEGFTYPSGPIWDLVSHPAAGDLVVGNAWDTSYDPSLDPYLGDHVLLWKLGACGQ